MTFLKIPKHNLATGPLTFISDSYTEGFSVTSIFLHNLVAFTGIIRLYLIEEGYDILILEKEINNNIDFSLRDEIIQVPALVQFKLTCTGNTGEIEGKIIIKKEI